MRSLERSKKGTPRNVEIKFICPKDKRSINKVLLKPYARLEALSFVLHSESDSIHVSYSLAKFNLLSCMKSAAPLLKQRHRRLQWLARCKCKLIRSCSSQAMVVSSEWSEKLTSLIVDAANSYYAKMCLKWSVLVITCFVMGLYNNYFGHCVLSNQCKGFGRYFSDFCSLKVWSKIFKAKNDAL